MKVSRMISTVAFFDANGLERLRCAIFLCSVGRCIIDNN